MLEAKEVQTPLSTSTSLTLNDGTTIVDQAQYKSIIGAFQYLSMTRPDIAYSANRLAQFMHKPITIHMTALKLLLPYLKATIFHGLHLHRGSSPSLYAFSDVNWACNKEDYTSTSAHLVFYGRSLISWKSSKQRAIACSSTKAEYRSLATTLAELTWI